MADTYGDITRMVRLHAGNAPHFLAGQWTKQAWRRLCDRRPWSFLRAEGAFFTNTSRDGTVTVTANSITVTGVGMTFVAGDVTRQFRIGTSRPITIASVDVGANTCTLDVPYNGASATATTARILDAYVTCPTDFGSFMAVMDPQNRWQLHTDITQDELNLWDPQRSTTGMPWALVGRMLASSGAATFELWPYALTAKQYPFYYWSRPDAFQDSDSLPGIIGSRSDILVTGALAEAASWPGTTDQKNPYFNLALAQAKKKEFIEELNILELRDEEIYMTWLETVSWVNKVPWAPLTASYLRDHSSGMGYGAY